MQVKYKRLALTLLISAILPQAALAQCESVTIELRHGPIDVVPGIVTELHSKDVSVRLSALRKLDDMGGAAEPFVPELIKVVDGVHDGERQQALGILRNLGPEAAAAVPILVQTLDDKQYIRDRAIETLQAIGPEAKPAIPALLHILQEGNLTSNAELALAAIGHEAIGPITKSLSDKNPDCRRLCISALSLLAADPKTDTADTTELIIPAISQMLSDSTLSIRQYSANALGAIGPSAKVAIPVLKKALADESVRSSARAAIKKIEQGDVE